MFLGYFLFHDFWHNKFRRNFSFLMMWFQGPSQEFYHKRYRFTFTSSWGLIQGPSQDFWHKRYRFIFYFFIRTIPGPTTKFWGTKGIGATFLLPQGESRAHWPLLQKRTNLVLGFFLQIFCWSKDLQIS